MEEGGDTICGDKEKNWIPPKFNWLKFIVEPICELICK